MAVQNLQSLVLRAARLAGVRATGVESKALFTVMGSNPAQAPSSSWHPLPGPYPIRTSTESSDGHRSQSMDPSARRAGRSASIAGVPGRIGSARIGGATILSSWSHTRGSLAGTPSTCAGGPKAFGHSPNPTGNRFTGFPRSYGAQSRLKRLPAMREAIA